MQRWQKELLMAHLMQRLLALGHNGRVSVAGAAVDPGVALAEPHRAATLSRRGPLWFAALRAWQGQKRQ